MENKDEKLEIKDKPVCMIVLGMAGSGKVMELNKIISNYQLNFNKFLQTTFVKKLAQFRRDEFNPYIVNLDPACRETPYPVNIDIRDTVNYKQVMKQYNLGPNGG